MPGKWGMHMFYSKAKHIRRILPDTRVLNKTSLIQFLQLYDSIYIKPNMEHTGKGIMKVWKSANEYHLVRVKDRIKRYSEIDTLTKYVMKITGKKPHIIQKTIPLAIYRGRPYDIRVMMMRDKNDIWRYTGMLAKVMGPSSVVSNVLRGKGYAIPVSQALKESVAPGLKQQQEIEHKLIQISYEICKRFNLYKYSSQIGIDYGVDLHCKIWLIEVNFDYPSHELFAHLKDKTMYRLIKRRYKEYQRFRKQAHQNRLRHRKNPKIAA